jgi:hypothetical protein
LTPIYSSLIFNQADLQTSDTNSHEGDTPDIFSDPFEDVLYYRYGFSRSAGYQTHWNVDEDTIRRRVANVLKCTGHVSINDRDQLPAIIDFVDSLLTSTFPHPFLCDLHPSHEFFLQGQPSTIVITATTEPNLFIIVPRQPAVRDAEWQLVVDGPTALECWRRSWGTSRHNLARNFIARGIEFNTGVPRTPGHAPLIRPPFRGLGRREQGYKPTPLDYINYEERLGEFLQQPHTRAALLKGGIAWRITKELLGDRRDSETLLGPSESVNEYGCLLSAHIPGKEELWDDSLSNDELDFICGVYHIATGKLIICWHVFSHYNASKAKLTSSAMHRGGRSTQRGSLVASILVTGHSHAKCGFRIDFKLYDQEMLRPELVGNGGIH